MARNWNPQQCLINQLKVKSSCVFTADKWIIGKLRDQRNCNPATNLNKTKFSDFTDHKRLKTDLVEFRHFLDGCRVRRGCKLLPSLACGFLERVGDWWVKWENFAFFSWKIWKPAKGVSTLLYAAMPSASPRRLPCLLFTLPSTCSTSTSSCLMSSQPSPQACPPSPRPTAPPTTRSRRRLDASDTATMALAISTRCLAIITFDTREIGLIFVFSKNMSCLMGGVACFHFLSKAGLGWFGVGCRKSQSILAN